MRGRRTSGGKKLAINLRVQEFANSPTSLFSAEVTPLHRCIHRDIIGVAVSENPVGYLVAPPFRLKTI